MKTVNFIAYILLIVGGLNWGLVGLFNIDLVAIILGSIPALQNVVYILVGVSAVLFAIKHSKKCCNTCDAEPSKKSDSNIFNNYQDLPRHIPRSPRTQTTIEKSKVPPGFFFSRVKVGEFSSGRRDPMGHWQLLGYSWVV
jgi:uncharacterized membrane protein YuzA (DUF378 family)